MDAFLLGRGSDGMILRSGETELTGKGIEGFVSQLKEYTRMLVALLPEGDPDVLHLAVQQGLFTRSMFEDRRELHELGRRLLEARRSPSWTVLGKIPKTPYESSYGVRQVIAEVDAGRYRPPRVALARLAKYMSPALVAAAMGLAGCDGRSVGTAHDASEPVMPYAAPPPIDPTE